jgi:hypothetical protein
VSGSSVFLISYGKVNVKSRGRATLKNSLIFSASYGLCKKGQAVDHFQKRLSDNALVMASDQRERGNLALFKGVMRLFQPFYSFAMTCW